MSGFFVIVHDLFFDASLTGSDTICDLGGATELANYGEYSGAPRYVTWCEVHWCEGVLV